MQSNSQKKNDKIYELTVIETKHSGKIVSRVVSYTFSLLVFLALITLIVIFSVKIDVTINASGQLEPADLKTIYNPINGEIEKIFVKSGEAFKKGDLLVQLDTLKLFDQLDEMNRKLSMKMIDYEKLSSTIPYEKNRITFQAKKAEAQLLKAKANLRQKINDFFTGTDPDSLIRNYKKGTHISLDYALADIITAETEIENLDLEKRVIDLKNYELQSFMLEIEQLKKTIQRQREYVNKAKLVAPYDGIMLTQNVENLEGSIVSEGSLLFEIGGDNFWKALLFVNEKDAYKIKIGDAVKIEVQAVKSDENDLILEGNIVNISGEPLKDKLAQQSSGNYGVEVEIKTAKTNEHLKKFKRGFSIEAKIIKECDLIINVLLKNIKNLL